MFKSVFGRFACIFTLLVSLIPVKQVNAMDCPQEGSAWFSKSLIALATPLAAYGWLYRKHSNELDLIERRLNRSSISATAKEHNFLSATWRSHKENTPNGRVWEWPADLWYAKIMVKDAFITDATELDDRVYIYSISGERYEPSYLKKLSRDECSALIAQSFAREKEWFEKQMEFVAQFTDVPERIVAACSPDEHRALEPFELAFGCVHALKDMKSENFDSLFQGLINDVETRAAHPLKKIVHCSTWLPTTWSLAPCYQQASNIYIKLFMMYTRLCALDAAWLES